MQIALVFSPENPETPFPAYATEGSAGFDIAADISTPLTISPGARALIPTGIKIAVPAGYEFQVRPRSGNALKHGLTVLNTPGTIDSDYRDGVGVVLINHGSAPVIITPGLRIAQGVIAPVIRADLVPVSALPDANSTRAGGFGSTGA